MNNDVVSKTNNKILDILKNRMIVSIVLLILLIVFVLSLLVGLRNTYDYLNKVHVGDALIISVTDNNTKFSNKHSYEVEFTDYKGKVVSSNFNSNNDYKINDHVIIYYKNTDKVYLHRDNPSILIISFISLILIILLLVLTKERKVNIAKKNKRILKSKKMIEARISNIIRNDKNNTKYYNIICKWNNPEDNREYTFNSEDLEFDPTITLNILHKNTINVYLDKNDYNKYYVDVREIKKNKI